MDETRADTPSRAAEHHSAEMSRAYDRVLAGSSVRRRSLALPSGQVHLLEKGDGPTLVMLHPTGNPAGFFLPLLNALDGVRAVAPDRPGVGLSDPVSLPWHAYRHSTVAWIDSLLDALGLDDAALLGHSGGGVLALWYALARPERVRRLVLVGTPALPKTRCPLPVRLISTPGLGAVLVRLSPPSRSAVLRLAQFLGERDTLAGYPDVLDLLVAAGRDRMSDRFTRNEFRALVSPFALLSPSGWRRRGRVRPEQLRGLSTRTLLIWGDRDPVGRRGSPGTSPACCRAVRCRCCPPGTRPTWGIRRRSRRRWPPSCADSGQFRNYRPCASVPPLIRRRMPSITPQKAPRPQVTSVTTNWATAIPVCPV